MRGYSIPDLLVGQTYYPTSLARKYQYGEINFAEKREGFYVEDHEVYSIRFNGDRWATVAVRIND